MNDLFLQLITASLIGLGAGYIGSFMVLRRMSLVGDALSHVALPGIALALIWNFNPFLGAFGVLFIAIVGISLLEKRTELPSETLVGIFFTVSLALGLLLTPDHELLEALLGNISQITKTDLIFTLASIAVIFATMRKISSKLLMGVISKELAQSMKIQINTINFVFFVLVAVIVALGLKVAGTLLMGSLVIIPAAAAKNISLSMASYKLNASLFGVVSGIAGIFIANYFNLHPGPMVVLSSGVIFLLTLVFKR